MIIWIDAEKLCDRVQCPFMRKALGDPTTFLSWSVFLLVRNCLS